MKMYKFIRVLAQKRHSRFGLSGTKKFGKYQRSLVILGVLLLVAIMDFSFSCFNQSSLAVQNTQKVEVSLEIEQTCAISASNTGQIGTMTAGQHEQIGGSSLFRIFCNDTEGYVIYAVGNGKGLDGVEAEGNTDLVGTDLTNRIITGTATSGEVSNWSFKLSDATGGLAIVDEYDEEVAVPKKRTAVASRATGVTSPEGDTFKASYAMYTNPLQVADTYVGKIKYVLFHPSWAGADGANTMQKWKGCGDLAEGELLTLRDERDGNLYKVAKLRDGKCWMVENLALGGENPIELTPEDSNVSRNWTLPAATDGWDLVFDFPYVHIGEENGIRNGYYPYIAATAGTGTTSTPKGDAKESICPKGWRLPSYAGDFSTMVYFYGGWDDPTAWAAAITTSPVPGFTLMGKYNHDGTDAEVGEAGYWWSSTTDGPGAGEGANANAWAMDVSTTRVSPGDAYNHPVGYSVRCIADQ